MLGICCGLDWIGLNEPSIIQGSMKQASRSLRKGAGGLTTQLHGSSLDNKELLPRERFESIFVGSIVEFSPFSFIFSLVSHPGMQSSHIFPDRAVHCLSVCLPWLQKW